MEKKDWKKTKWKLNAIAVEYNLIERIDKIEEELEGLLDKAREEGIRETLEEVLGEMRELEYLRSKGLRNVVDIEEVYKKVENRMIKLDKLKQ